MYQPKYLLYFLFCISNSLFAQKLPLLEWGVIPPEDLSMTHCARDSSATAYVLQDAGVIKLIHTDHGPEVVFSRHRRVKIFDPKAFDEGNLRIYYRSNRKAEKFEDLEVQTISPDGVRKKVKSDNVFTEIQTDQFNAKKVFIPNLEKGTIIEYRYKLRSSDYYTLYDWYFQEEIPVRWSQVEVSLPEYSRYASFSREPRPYDLLETRMDKPEFFSNAQYNRRVTTYGYAHMPALKDDEPFVKNANDHLARLWFQRELDFWRTTEEDSVGWSDLSYTLTQLPLLGWEYLDTTAHESMWKAFVAQRDSKQDSTQWPYEALKFVSHQISWDGNFARISHIGVDEAFSRKKGSSAEINLAVLALLKRMQIRAYPVLLSTRQHGEPIPHYPYIPQFNALIALAIVGNDSFLLDATNPYYAVNQLNLDCYNKTGWVVNGQKPFWIPIREMEESATYLGEMTLTETGDLKGKFTITVGGGQASFWRQKALESKDKSTFFRETFAQDYPGAQLDSIVMEPLDNNDLPLKIDLNCHIPGAASVINDYLYLKPVLDFMIRKNPFDRPSRVLPINLHVPLKVQYVLNLNLPPNYQVEELPAPARISLPENGGRIQFNCGINPQKQIQLVYKVQITRLEYPPEEYGALRHFFALIEEKNELQLVLRKL